jgi:hypothetical protein
MADVSFSTVRTALQDVGGRSSSPMSGSAACSLETHVEGLWRSTVATIDASSGNHDAAFVGGACGAAGADGVGDVDRHPSIAVTIITPRIVASAFKRSHRHSLAARTFKPRFGGPIAR